VRDLATVDGVMALDDEERPGFAVKGAAEPARRFALCRELFEYLATSPAAPAIVTRGATHRQQRNRAFAAEFLLPSAALRGRFPDKVATIEDVNKVADEFAVSWAVISHQLTNHRIAEIPELAQY
jgi:Zn-dependent peptidase ImmA (M78 family)